MCAPVSRTATAPFDRLKVYLITTPSTPTDPPPLGGKAVRRNKGSIPAAVRVLWRQGGGLQAFWTGNGLNVVKIFPVRPTSSPLTPRLTPSI
jgi:solute carrier family 25 phosphate transporter 23/24/25/41